MNEQVEVVVAGLICLDIIPALKGGQAVFEPGHVLEAGPAILATGGAVANTGLALHRLGVTPLLVGKVGADLFGGALRSLLEARGDGLGLGLVLASDQESTSYSLILSPPGADRMFIHSAGANATFQAADVPYHRLESARLFHFGYPPLMAGMYLNCGAELVAMFSRAKATGVTTSLDMAMPDANSPAGRVNWPAVLQRTLPFVDVFLPSLEELLVMLDKPAVERISREAGKAHLLDLIPAKLVSELGQRLVEMGAGVIGIKAGHRGFYLRTAGADRLSRMGRAFPFDQELWADRELWIPCFATRVAGTTGSGDATIAGFLRGLLHGMTPEDTMAAACAVGACSVEAQDAISGIQGWPETAGRMAKGWPKLPLAINAAGWEWNEPTSIWLGPADKFNEKPGAVQGSKFEVQS